MKNFIGIAAGLMAILMVNGMSAWSLRIENSRFNKDTARVDAKWGGILCSDNYAMFIQPGGNADIYAGICDLKSVHVNYPHGEDMYFNKQTGNPVSGLGIITIRRGEKDKNGRSLEKYKVVPIEVMRADDRKLAEKANAQRG